MNLKFWILIQNKQQGSDAIGEQDMWKSFKEFISVNYHQWWAMGVLWLISGWMIGDDGMHYSGFIMMVMSLAWESIEQKIDGHKP
jgi:hypothetical protein